MMGASIVGSEVIASFSLWLYTVSRDPNAMFMSDENVDSPSKITADTTAANANFME